jgi:hypothetical protein
MEAQNMHEIIISQYSNTLMASQQQRIEFQNMTLPQFLH